MSCTHPTIETHKKDGAWICSWCTAVFKWGPEASYFGSMECRKCGRAAIAKVFCSTLCRAFAGDPKDWRDYGKADLGKAAAGGGVSGVLRPGAPEAADLRRSPDPDPARGGTQAGRTTSVRLTEAELMEIMADLIEASKGKFCDPDRSDRIWMIIEKKIDPAMRTLRLG